MKLIWTVQILEQADLRKWYINCSFSRFYISPVYSDSDRSYIQYCLKDEYDGSVVSFYTISEAKAAAESAISDEKYELKVIGNFPGEDSLRLPSKKLIDRSKYPFSGQPGGYCEFFLLKDVVAVYQALIDKHGATVGYTTHHCGMGQDATELGIMVSIDEDLKRFN